MYMYASHDQLVGYSLIVKQRCVHVAASQMSSRTLDFHWKSSSPALRKFEKLAEDAGKLDPWFKMNNNKYDIPAKKMDCIPQLKYSTTLPHPRKGVWGAAVRGGIPSLTTGKDLKEEVDFLVQNCSNSEDRITCQLKMIRRELKTMRMQDQVLLRQLLRIYAMINDLYGNAQDPSPSNHGSMDQIMADEVPELLMQSGNLDIRDIVSRLSPIRRRRGSDPETLYGDVSSILDLECDGDDVLSVSSPIYI